MGRAAPTHGDPSDAGDAMLEDEVEAAHAGHAARATGMRRPMPEAQDDEFSPFADGGRGGAAAPQPGPW